MRHIQLAAGLAVMLTLTACATREPAGRDLVRDPTACAPARFEVYFADGRADLTSAARQAISLNATRLQGCDIARVRVLGLADARTGTASANLTLSERRARVVAETLAAQGLPAPAFEVLAAGEDGAERPDGAQEPMRRRTEILIDTRR